MELPVFRQIKIDTSSKDSILMLLEEINLGSYPMYITLSDSFSQVESEIVINEILSYLKRNDINQFIPFPIYIITNSVKYSSNILLCKTLKELPSYFKVARKSPGHRESQILKRILILVKRLNNNIVEENLKYIRTAAPMNKKILHNSKEIDFYQKILNYRGK